MAACTITGCRISSVTNVNNVIIGNPYVQGTVMENSKLPFMYWYIAMHLLTSTKKSFSAAELQRQLGHKRYQPIWEMECKLRDVMGKRDNLYQLTDEVELDNAFITTLIPEEEKDKPLKRGVGS
ncbi:MAG: IS1595 family transposase [Paludibacteraceae bacterium]|nr:IS1595 family transposase [Paludibacteraceae bacterium]